ncbi:MAG: hypothetical protein WC894_03550 [Patescibacteria group bacterium]
MVNNLLGETITGLGSAWTAAKKSFTPVIESAKRDLKEVVPSIKNASRQVLSNARDSATMTINNLVKDDGKGLKLLGQSAGLLAVDATLAYLSSHIHPAVPELQTRANIILAVTGLINGGVGVFTADKASQLYNHMKIK